jgi:peptide/nickel transport system permease protein
MKIGYLIRRLLFLFAVVWVAATLVFFIPRLSTRNPIRERFAEIARSTGFAPKDLEQIIAAYEVKFGLNKPLLEQYVEYMGGVLRGDLGPSLTRFPVTVLDLILTALPWTIGLLVVTTLIAFALGNLLGALASWPRSPAFIKGLMAPLMMLQAIPAYLLGLLLIFFIAFRLRLLPMGGAYSQGVLPSFTLEFILDAARHQILPAISLILSSVGFWALGMRGMGVTIQGEDYVTFAEHKGLKPVHDLHALLHAQRAAPAGHWPGLGLWQHHCLRRAGRAALRPPRPRRRAWRRNPEERLLRHLRHHALCDPRDRHPDVPDGPDIPNP